jgi:signal peptidase I
MLRLGTAGPSSKRDDGAAQAAAECINCRTDRSIRAYRAVYAALRTRAPAPRTTGRRAPPYPYTAGLVTRRPLGCLFEIVETLVLTLIIFFVIQTFVAQPYRVEQQSMERTLEPDQYVLVDKLTPRFDDYSRGDIIVFEPPEAWAEGGHATPFIKRVIGLPGETIEIQDGEVLVDGTPLDEPYLYDLQPTTAVEEPASWVIPEGELFVMGDHRAASADSRAFGPISRDKVIGRAWVRYWPISAVGILPTPQYPPPVGNGDARPSPAVP